MALLCANVERTIQFYQDLLSSPSRTSSRTAITRGRHIFLRYWPRHTIAFFDFPGLDLGTYQEVLGGLHHLALSMEPEQWERIKAKLDAAEVAYQQIGRSLYFRDPDGTRLELLRDPLGEMNGKRVLRTGLRLQGIGRRVRGLAMQDAEHIFHRHDRLALDALVGA